MKRITLSLVAMGILSAFNVNAPAKASDLSVVLNSLFNGGHQIARENHAQHHDDLEHRSYHRELEHRAAHRYPMTHRQHDGLHDGLEHDAYHDRVEHRSAHRTGAYSPNRSFRYMPHGRTGRYGSGTQLWFGY